MAAYDDEYKDRIKKAVDDYSNYGKYESDYGNVMKGLRGKIRGYGSYDSDYQKDINKTKRRIENYGNYDSKFGDVMKGLRTKIRGYGDYKSDYQSQIDNLANKMMSGYNPQMDATYNNYKQAYTRQGKQAMQDTIAQAAALSGGFDNSYAQSVGQQTYNQYMSQLADKIPELEQAAMDMWGTKLGVLQNLDNTAYGRWADKRSNLYDMLNMYRTEDETAYGRWNDRRNNLYDQMNMYRGLDETAYGRWNDRRDNLYDLYNLYKGQDDTAYGRWADERNNLREGIDLYRNLSADDFDRWLALYQLNNAGSAGGSGGGRSGGRSGGSGSGSSSGYGGFEQFQDIFKEAQQDYIDKKGLREQINKDLETPTWDNKKRTKNSGGRYTM